MCPACYQSAALIFAGLSSSGGIARFVFSKLSKKAAAKKIHKSQSEKKMMNRTQQTAQNETDGLPRLVSHDEWLRAHKELLAQEKEFNRQLRQASAADRIPLYVRPGVE